MSAEVEEISYDDDRIQPLQKPLKTTSHKKQKVIHMQFDAKLQSTEVRKNLKTKWNEFDQYTVDLSEPNCKLRLDVHPYRICVIENLLNDPTFTTDLLTELENLEFTFQKSDLFQFSVGDLSHDVLRDRFKNLDRMLTFLENDVFAMIRDVTGLDIVSTVASTSLYKKGDYLLPHDDRSGKRAVAFVYYVVPNDIQSWSSDFGGELALYETDENTNPTKIVKSIFPKNNQFIFFAVNERSYHRVNEMLTELTNRWTINGWFNFEERITIKEQICRYTGLYAKNRPQFTRFHSITLSHWIRRVYLKKRTCDDIVEGFKPFGEISLSNFFHRKVFQKVTYYLKNGNNVWLPAGPLSLRHYETLDLTQFDQGHLLTKFVSLFHSPKLLCLLAHYLQCYDYLCDYKRIRNDLRFEIQRWSVGNYSIVSDKNWFSNNAIEVILYFDYCNDDDEIGRWIYLYENERDVLKPRLEVIPKPNSLNLIYREGGGNSRMVSYLQQSKNPQPFYVFLITYPEGGGKVYPSAQN